MAGLLAALCALHILGGVAHAGILGEGFGHGFDVLSGSGGGCSSCDLSKMVTDCPLDVMFMLDMSDSIPDVDYETARAYIVRQIRILTDTYQGTDVGFLAFSDVVHNDYSIRRRSSHDLQEMLSAISVVKQQRFETQLADALRWAREALVAHKALSLSPAYNRGKLIVLVSDGCEDNDRAVRREAILARSSKISIISVHVSKAYMELLKAISVEILEPRTNIDWSSLVACPKKYLPVVDPGQQCSDFIIAMDGSDSVRRWEKVMRTYLGYTASRFMGLNDAMGIVVFGTDVNTQSSETMIKPRRHKELLPSDIQKKLKFPNKRGTGTAAAILKSIEYLQELAQSPLSKTIIIITDGPALHPEAARQALSKATELGFKVLVIGVGSTVSLPQLQEISGPGTIVKQVPSYLDLYSFDLSAYLCQTKVPCSNLPPCGQGQTRNPNANCQCLPCSNLPPCGQGQTRNPNANCQCQCIPRNCVSGSIQNPTTCQCEPECHNTLYCDGNQVPNFNTCQCEPKCQNIPYCDGNQVPNFNTCQCECRQPIQSCQSGYQFNRSTCKCESMSVCRPQQPCQNGYYLNEKDCKCVCIPQNCLGGRIQNPITCQCDCPAVNCGIGRALNTNNCHCEPRCLTSCPSGYVPDRNTCKCNCQRNCRQPIQSCQSGYQFNRSTCKCEPKCQNTMYCQGNQELNLNTCQCECRQPIQSCQSGYQFNSYTCKCECRQPIQSCQSGYQFNSYTCKCESVCRLQQPCQNGYYLNEKDCKCEPKCQNTLYCQGNQELNLNTCQCECRQPIPSCQSGYQFNSSTCKCECTRQSCSGGKIWNPHSCQCDCPTCTVNCGFGRTLNMTNCQYECVPQNCFGGRIQNPRSCQCDCPTVNCGFGRTLNMTNCQCECVPQNCFGGRIQNPRSCQCECTRQSCGGGRIRNPTTCQCDCPAVNCGIGRALNTNNCQCDCQRNCRQPIQSCQSGYQFNRSTCKCEPKCQNTMYCQGNQELNLNTCQCECRQPIPSCQSGYQFNSYTCKCESVCRLQQPCQNGYYLNEKDCKCEPKCQNTMYCQGNQELNLNTCQCECRQPIPSCQSGYHFNSSTCKCECTRQSCGGGRIRNPTTCQCDCPAVNCGIGRALNTNNCQCDCQRNCRQPIQSCQSGYQFNRSTCKCEPKCQNTMYCQGNQELNLNTCQCECRQPIPSCQSGYQFNSYTCKCESVCRLQQPCQNGYYLNEKDCKCEPKCQNTMYCQGNQELNLNTCQCECRQPIPSCQSGYHFNSSTCKCECIRQSCSGGKIWNPHSCQCDCPAVNCGIGRALNTNDCQCEPRCLKSCPSGYVQGPNSCKCTCQRENCPAGMFQNPINCLCDCQRSCPQGQYLDRAACQCRPVITPTPQRTCPAHLNRCKNGQVAVRDCQNRCVCLCDTTKYAGAYCEIVVEASMCDNCSNINGHYLAPVWRRCDMFVTCQPTGVRDGEYIPWIRHCPEGLVFVQDSKVKTARCDYPTAAPIGSCRGDPCASLAPNAKYPDSQLCARYWQCDSNRRTASSHCCPAGQGFNSDTQSCQTDPNCPNSCAKDPSFVSCNGGGGRVFNTCPYVTKADDPQRYYDPRAPTHAYFACGGSDYFNETVCTCLARDSAGCKPFYRYTFDGLSTRTLSRDFKNINLLPQGGAQYAHFNGNSRILLQRFSGSGFHTYLEISLRVRLTSQGGGGEMAILSNGDCMKSHTLAITTDRQNVYFRVVDQKGSRVITLPYVAGSDGWLGVKLQYEMTSDKVYRLTATVVGGQTQSINLDGKIKETACTLQIGHGLGYRSLVGDVDDVYVWVCKPNGTTGKSGIQTPVSPYYPYNSGSNTRTGGTNTYWQMTNTYD